MPEMIDYSELDDGLGGTYERIAYGAMIERLAERFGARKLLELNATFIAGVPGFNSGILAQNGFDVTITVHSRDYRETLEAWKISGLSKRVRILEWNNDLEVPFGADEFDLVWNHLAFEHYRDPTPLVREMARVSKDLVMNLTLNPFNIGFPMHWVYHKLAGKEWDHGFLKNTLISTVKKTHITVGLTPVDWGGCDAPPWIDTVDLQIGGSMRYIGGAVGQRRWVWGSTNPAARRHSLIRMLWRCEMLLPAWYRTLVAHHLYVASRKQSRVVMNSE